MTCHKFQHRGFTLLEVMVALLIFALTGMAVMKAATDHLTSVGQIEEITFATWVANNRLTQLSLSNTWPLKNKQKGMQEMAGRKWYWQQELLKTPDEGLIGVEISVGLDENYQDRVTSVTSYFAKP
jgi:general secretion pathway protein I